MLWWLRRVFNPDDVKRALFLQRCEKALIREGWDVRKLPESPFTMTVCREGHSLAVMCINRPTEETLATFSRVAAGQHLVPIAVHDGEEQESRLEERLNRAEEVALITPGTLPHLEQVLRLRDQAREMARVAAEEARATERANARQRLAEAVGNQAWNEAIAAWQALATFAAVDENSVMNAGLAYRRLGRMAEAMELLERGHQVYPSHAQIAIDLAWVSLEMSDATKAVAHWRAAFALAPHQSSAFHGLALSLRRAGAFDEADRVLTEGLARHPANPALVVEYAWTASQAGHWSEAVTRWRDACGQVPDQPSPVHGLGLALRHVGRHEQSDRVLIDGIRRFPDFVYLAADYAWNATFCKNWPEAIRRWERVATMFPSDSIGFVGGMVALRESGDLIAAESAFSVAEERFPQDQRVQQEGGWIAVRRHDWSSATSRFRRGSKLGMTNVSTRHGLVIALMKSGDLDAAESVIHNGDLSPALANHYALIAQRRGDSAEALSRWRVAFEMTPEDPSTHAGLAGALIENLLHEEADTLLSTAIARFPEVPVLHFMRANHASQRENYNLALSLWEAAHQRFPDDMWGITGLAGAQAHLGRAGDARRILDRALQTLPDDPGLLRVRAELEERADNWDEAIAFWTRLAAISKDDRTLQRLLNAQTRVLIESDNPIPNAATTFTPNSSAAKLVMAFESLGDNCEIGVLQRRCGFEPLGLLRWAAIQPSLLITALQYRFDGVGDPRNVFAEVSHSGEYVAGDTRYGMQAHSFTYAASVSREKFLAGHVRRTCFLREKLLRDLEVGKKIMVFKSAEITEHQIADLLAAVRAIGPAPLLVVRLASDEHSPGHVRDVGDGLMLGYIDRFGPRQKPGLGMSTELWLQILQRAYGFVHVP